MPIATSSYVKYRDDVLIPDPEGLTPIDKNYVRVLFKPGYNVQTRELNTLQTLIQNQLAQVGTDIYEDGGRVINGNIHFEPDIDVIEFVDNDELFEDFVRLASPNVVRGVGSTTEAVISHWESIDDTTSELPQYRLYVKYKSGDGKFAAGAAISVVDEAESVQFSTAATATSKGVGATIEKGVYFIKGVFVVVNPQSVYLKTGTSTFNGNVVLNVKEYTVSHSGDLTLLDNASSGPNYAAEGADRYAIDLELNIVNTATDAQIALTDASTAEQVEAIPPAPLVPSEDDIDIEEDEAATTNNSSDVVIQPVKDGAPTGEAVNDSQRGLNDKLAKRTFEESGNYTVNSFPIRLREVFATGDNDGIYETASEIFNSGNYPVEDVSEDSQLTDAQKADIIVEAQDDYAVVLDPSVAYVKGQRVELTRPATLIAKKSRERFSDINGKFENFSVTAQIGSYVDGNATSGMVPLTNQTFTYELKNNTDNTIGSVKIRGMEHVGSQQRLYISDISFINDTIALSDIDRIVGNNIVGYGTFDFSVVDANISSTNINSNIYRLPYDMVTSIGNINQLRGVVRDDFQVVSDDSGTFTMSLPQGNSNFSDISAGNLIVFNIDDNSIVDPADVNIASVTASAATLSISGISSSTSFTVNAPVERDLSVGTKTLKTTTVANITAETGWDAGEQLLTTSAFGHVVSVSDGFTLEHDGQNEGTYGNALIRRVNAAKSSCAITYFELSQGDVYTVSSYLNETGEGSSVPLELEDFPFFQGMYLNNALDFRYSESDSDNVAALDPYSSVSGDIDFCLSRIDRIVVLDDGVFDIIQGDPAISPQLPDIPSNAMDLYTLRLLPYTFSMDDIGVQAIDNRRYTMRDIGEIEARVNRLEYYTSLSLLEKSANDTSILEGSAERFKNGFIVDSFRDHSIGDSSQSEYNCAIDSDNASCRPYFKTDAIEFDADNLNSINATQAYPFSGQHPESITLPYKEVTLVEQLKASIGVSVNPYDLQVYIGSMKLSPSTDFWIDNERQVVKTIDDLSLINSTRADLQRRGVLGTQWGSWQTAWAGRAVGQRILSSSVSSSSSSSSRQVRSGGLFRRGGRRGTETSTRTITTRTDRVQNLQQFGLTRTGVETTVTDSGQTRDTVTDSKFVSSEQRPFMRSRQVLFNVTNLKPYATYYAFFDDIDVNSYTRQLTEAQYDTLKSEKSLITDQETLNDSIPGESTGTLIADENGDLWGVFILPNNDTRKFVTGQRLFKISDSRTNSVGEATATAETEYNASGLLNKYDITITSTRIPQIDRTRVSGSTVVTRASGPISNQSRVISDRTTTRTTWRDPLAQTILFENPNGVFLTSVDLFFSAIPPKSTDKCHIHIVTTENGIPTNNIVPYSEVAKSKEFCFVSQTGSSTSRFRFEQPVYLQSGVEYAIIIYSNSPEYKVWVAEKGGYDVKTAQLISKSPYAGVFLTSQNASTWTPEQNRDLKFRANQAKFDVSQTRKVKFKSDVHTGVTHISLTDEADSIVVDGAITVEIETPSDVNGIQAEAEAILDSSSSKIAGILVTKRGSGYLTNDPSVVVKIDGVATTETLALAHRVIHTPSLFNLISEDITFGSKATVQYSLITDNGLYNKVEPRTDNIVYPSDPITITRSKRLTMDISMNSGDADVSPVVDRDRLSLIAITNDISMDENDTSAYVTKEILIDNPADQVDVYFSAHRPIPTSGFSVYTQVKYVDGSYSEWTSTPLNSPKVVPLAVDSEYSDVHYRYSEESREFSAFRIKIVMLSSDHTAPCYLSSFRAIASL